MSLFSFGKSAATSPYDWTTMASDPLTENPKVLSALAPWQTAVGSAATAAATRLGTPDAGDDAIYNTLRTQAGDDLALGGQLSADEVRATDQGVLAGASARGMANAPMTGFMAALRRSMASDARRTQRQGQAMNVLGLGQQRRAGDASLLQTTGLLGNQNNEFAEDIRRFGLNRYDTRQFNKNNIQKDLQTANKNAAAAKSAGKSNLVGAVVGGILSFI